MERTVLGKRVVKFKGGKLKHPASAEARSIGHEPCIVGRGENCTLRIEDSRVSLVHCRVVATDEGVLVTDAHSKNGTWLGDVCLLPEHPARIYRPTVIRLGGDVTLLFTPTESETEHELASHFGKDSSRSKRMQWALTQLRDAAKDSEPVLLLGETGTGKTRFAELIHEESARAKKKFITIDCGTLNPNLIESELFGHERGAFSGATQRKESPFFLANGGTVFLDEIGEIPFHLQAKLLRVIDRGLFIPVGGTREVEVDVRIIAATLQPLAEQVNAKTFRPDLYSRLQGTEIQIPPLRERIEDIPVLAKQILAGHGRPEAWHAISRKDLAWLKKLPWVVGNVRQLEQLLVRSVGRWTGTGDLPLVETYRVKGGRNDLAPADIGDAPEGLLRELTKRGTTDQAVRLEARRLLYSHLIQVTSGNRQEIGLRAGVAQAQLRRLLRTLDLDDHARPPRRRAAAALDRL